MIVAAAAVLGAVVGSFLNVVIWRVPRGESVVRPRSACPSCGTALRPLDNIPIVSWLVLRGKCRYCGAAVSVRYLVVEVLTAVLFALVAWHFGLSWALPAYLYLAAIAVALAVIDLDVKRLPNVIVLPAYPVMAVLLVVASAGASDWNALLRAAIGGAVLFVLYFLLLIVYPAGMGFGDVKLAGVLGMALAWLGWGALVVGAFAGFLLGGVFGIALLLARKAGRKTGVPFGPWMLLGAGVGIAWGEGLWGSYLSTLTG